MKLTPVAPMPWAGDTLPAGKPFDFPEDAAAVLLLSGGLVEEKAPAAPVSALLPGDLPAAD